MLCQTWGYALKRYKLLAVTAHKHIWMRVTQQLFTEVTFVQTFEFQRMYIMCRIVYWIVLCRFLWKPIQRVSIGEHLFAWASCRHHINANATHSYYIWTFFSVKSSTENAWDRSNAFYSTSLSATGFHFNLAVSEDTIYNQIKFKFNVIDFIQSKNSMKFQFKVNSLQTIL